MLNYCRGGAPSTLVDPFREQARPSENTAFRRHRAVRAEAGGCSMQEGESAFQHSVADEGDGVQNGVGDDQGAYPLEAQKKEGKDCPHDRVADEAAEALVEMVAASQ